MLIIKALGLKPNDIFFEIFFILVEDTPSVFCLKNKKKSQINLHGRLRLKQSSTNYELVFFIKI
jgi:hypothetical protein